MDDDLTWVINELDWRKSYRSNGNGGGNCVEVAGSGSLRAVRDSKDPSGPILVFEQHAWDRFVDSLK